MSDPAPVPPVVANILCRTCGRTEPVRQDQLTEYVRQGWPTCCGRFMALSDPTDKPAPLNCPGCTGLMVSPAAVCPRCGWRPPDAPGPVTP